MDKTNLDRIRERLKNIRWIDYMEPILIEDEYGFFDVVPNFAEYLPETEYKYHGSAWDWAFNLGIIEDFKFLYGYYRNFEVTDYVVDMIPYTPVGHVFLTGYREDGTREVWVSDEVNLKADTRFYHVV